MYEIYCKIRDSKGLKDAEVAKLAGITKSTFTDWKNGRSEPKMPKLIKIADALGVDISEFNGNGDSILTKAQLDVRIAKDDKLKKAIEKYYTLNGEKQDYIINLIDMLSGE